MKPFEVQLIEKPLDTGTVKRLLITAALSTRRLNTLWSSESVSLAQLSENCISFEQDEV